MKDDVHSTESKTHLTGEVSSQEDGPIGRRMELVVVTGREVNDTVVELVEWVRQEAMVVGEIINVHQVLAREQSLKRSKEANQ